MKITTTLIMTGAICTYLTLTTPAYAEVFIVNSTGESVSYNLGVDNEGNDLGFVGQGSGKDQYRRVRYTSISRSQLVPIEEGVVGGCTRFSGESGWSLAYKHLSGIHTDTRTGDRVFYELDMAKSNRACFSMTDPDADLEVVLNTVNTGGTGQYEGACGEVVTYGSAQNTSDYLTVVESTGYGEIRTGVDCDT